MSDPNALLPQSAVSESVSSNDDALPAGWSRGYSNSQKRTYYFHAETKHTQWHFPTASEVADPRKAKKRAELNKAQEKRKIDEIKSSTTSGLGTIVDQVHISPQSRTPTAAASGRSNYNSNSNNNSSNSSNKRAKIDNRIDNADDAFSALADSTCVAIIVPYRDIHVEQKRAAHLAKFIPHMHRFFDAIKSKHLIHDYHIYIVEQSDDGRKFNRGKLLNIGFDHARKKARNNNHQHQKHDVFIFHDVDLLPSDDLGPWYAQFPQVPIHIARVWDRYSNNPKYFGGVVSFSESDYKRINGYPNTFWGWGGEDDEMQNRLEKLRIKWKWPPSGSLVDLEKMTLHEKLNFLRDNKEWKCMVKWEALEEHATNWKTNGLADLKYKVLETTDLDETKKATKVTVDVLLNNHWADEKCGVDYMPPPNHR